jgi:four helix bundle protein
MARSYRELVVWQKAIELATLLYRLTQQFPREEIYGLTSQLRRAGVSVASNTGEYRSFVGMARGSALEIQTQLVIARELSLGDAKQLAHAEALSEEISKMLWAIRQRLGSVSTAH